MIKLKCACGATIKIEQQLDSVEQRTAEDWLTRHKSCRTEYWVARPMTVELGSRDKYIKELRKDIAFYRNCLNSGKTPIGCIESGLRPPGDEGL